LTKDLAIQVFVCALEGEITVSDIFTEEITERADASDVVGDSLVLCLTANIITLEVETGNIHTDVGKTVVSSV